MGGLFAPEISPPAGLANVLFHIPCAEGQACFQMPSQRSYLMTAFQGNATGVCPCSLTSHSCSLHSSGRNLAHVIPRTSILSLKPSIQKIVSDVKRGENPRDWSSVFVFRLYERDRRRRRREGRGGRKGRRRGSIRRGKRKIYTQCNAWILRAKFDEFG